MRESTTADDPRPESVVEMMAERWHDHKDEYRDDDNYPGSEVVYEDDEIAVVADLSGEVCCGHLLPDMLRDYDIPTGVVRTWAYDIARDVSDYDWSDASAIVFTK
jgi:hypothetical protein